MAALTPAEIASVILVVAGLILSLVGIFSPAWVETAGLFKVCAFGTCTDITLGDMEDYFKATVAMEILAFLSSLVCVAGVGVHFVFGLLGKSSDMVAILPGLAVIASIVEASFAILGCIIFAAKGLNSQTPNYAFFLTIIGAVCLVVGCVIFYKNNKNSGVRDAM